MGEIYPSYPPIKSPHAFTIRKHLKNLNVGTHVFKNKRNQTTHTRNFGH